MRKLTLLVSLLLITNVLAVMAVDDVIGEVVYIEGDVTLYRDSEILDYYLDFGTEVENFDHLEVGPDGFIEIEIYRSTGIGSTIKVNSNSALYLDITSLQTSQRGGVELLNGTASFNVAQLVGGSQLDIRTSNATMGVRGTEFDVQIAVNGEVLLSTSEGRVEVTTDTDEVLYSVPGQVVQRGDDNGWENLPVATTELESFRRNWITDRIEAYRANPGRALRFYATRYIELKDRFIDAYVDLMRNRDVIESWIQEDRRGEIGGTATRLRQKRQLVGALLRLRAVLFMYERVYYRIVDLYGLFQEGIGSGTITQGLDAARFFRQFRDEQSTFAQRMIEVRYILKLYALRNEGRSPLDIFTNDGFENADDFFGSSNGFFDSSDGF
jgi:hypothetical protein